MATKPEARGGSVVLVHSAAGARPALVWEISPPRIVIAGTGEYNLLVSTFLNKHFC